MLNKLILIGYRATGKSSLAIGLAQRLDFKAIDSDPLIEERAQKSIARIFSEEGESVFRDWEEQIILEILNSKDSLVLATGGGAPLRKTSRQKMREAGCVIWLQATVETIFERMFSDLSTEKRRPALTDLSPKVEIENVLQQRSHIYKETAHYSVQTDQRPLSELIDEILLLYTRFLS